MANENPQRFGAAGRPTADSFFSQSPQRGGYAQPTRVTPAGPGGFPPKKRGIDYPRAGKTGFMRWVPSWKLVTGSALSIIALLSVLFIAAYIMIPVPPGDPAAKATTVVDDSGKQLGQISLGNRVTVELKQIPEHVQNAVLAAEDRDFWTHGGVSISGTLRAAWSNLRGGGTTQGGSTITQQYVKNFYLQDTRRSYDRKLREFIIAIKLAQQTDREDILQDYLNKIYFGRNASGIQAAAAAYFGKDVSKLSKSEGAYLGGIIAGPELFDPADGVLSRNKAIERWKFTLDGMVKMGELQEQEARKVIAAGLPKMVSQRSAKAGDSQWGYIRAMIEQEAKKYGFEPYALQTGGFTIRTSLNKKMMAEATKAVYDKMGPPSKWPAGTQAGLASIDPKSGALKAFYGGNFNTRQVNAAVQDRPMGGSTYKVFALIAALQGVPAEDGHDQIKPINLKSRYNGANGYTIGKTQNKTVAQKVFNFDNQSFGCIDVITATAKSVNTVYAKLNERVGSKATARVAFDAGLPRDKTTDPVRSIDATSLNMLGAGNASALQMASVYGVVANQGVRVEPYVIESISKDKTVKFQREDWAKQPGVVERVFRQEVMADVTYALRQVVNSGSGSYASSLGRPAAGKTGTAGIGDQADAARKSDNAAAWFVGFTPQLSTAVALHRVSSKGGTAALQPWKWKGYSPGNQITGASYPVRVWTEYMKAALDGKPQEDFPQPKWDGEVEYGQGCAAPPPEQPQASTQATTAATTPVAPVPSQPVNTVSQPQQPNLPTGTGDPTASQPGQSSQPVVTSRPKPSTTYSLNPQERRQQQQDQRDVELAQ